MSKSARELLLVAQSLLDQPQAGEFHIRRCISTAYYAAMHAVLDFAVSELDGDKLLPSLMKAQLQRSVEHTHLESLSNQLNSQSDTYEQFSLQKDIRNLGKSLVWLYKQRIEADYDLTKEMSLTTAETAISSGNEILHLLSDIRSKPEDARLLAIKVLLPVKKKGKT